jgi:Prokaryotic N-terminal methylation motif
MSFLLKRNNGIKNNYRSKYSFTLLEILIVMTLIATFLGAMALPISKALRKERFETAVKAVIGKITLATEVMLDFRTDVTLKLQLENQEVVCTILPQMRLPEHIEKGFNHKNEIKGISTMLFNDKAQESIEIHFEGTLGSISAGEIALINGNLKEVITLPGYPAQIHKGKHAQTTYHPTYPQEILSAY